MGRREADRRTAWFLLLVFVLVLLSFFSAGLFLYSVVVVVVAYAVSSSLASSAVQDLEARRHLSATEVELGAQVHAQVVLHNRKRSAVAGLYWQERVDPGLDVEGARAAFRRLEGGASERLSFRLHTTRRGLFRIGPLVAEGSDPMGLVRRYHVDDQASFLTVLPRTVAMGQGWPLGHQPVHQTPRRRSLFEDPSRFQGIRAYRPGDGLRRVHWRATARSGELQVKVFEPTVLSGLCLAVDMNARLYGQDRTQEDADEELVITTAASLGRFVLEGGQRVALLSNGADAVERYPADWTGGTFQRFEQTLDDGSAPTRRLVVRRPVELEPGRGDLHRRRLQVLLARLCPASGAPLADLLHLELPHLSRSLVTMVITPHLDEDLASALGALRRSGLECAVVWVRSGDQERPSMAVPEGVPLYRVRRASDLEYLGNLRL